MRYLGEQFAAALPELAGAVSPAPCTVDDTKIALRVERAGDTVYALDIQRGGIGGDETVNFVVLGGSAELFDALWKRIDSVLTAADGKGTRSLPRSALFSAVRARSSTSSSRSGPGGWWLRHSGARIRRNPKVSPVT